jgi:cob(I)alamin adenosyltransferase
VSEVRQNLRNEHVAAMKADLAQLKAELSEARASGKKKLQETIDQLEARIDSEQKKIEGRAAFHAGQKAKGAILNKNAAAAGRALKDLANTRL